MMQLTVTHTTVDGEAVQAMNRTTSQSNCEHSATTPPSTSPAKMNDSGHSRMRKSRASRGQVLILFAAAMVALIGMLGLATDMGYGFIERRTMQNAADAGALAGAHALSHSDPSNPISVLDQVRQAAWANKVGNVHPTVKTCTYVDDEDHFVANCDVPAPSNASGVHVIVGETHDTFFLRALPGGPTTMSTRASATANVQLLETPPTNGPFLVCGIGTKTVSGPNIDIVIQSDGKWVVNPAAVSSAVGDGPVFQIYGPNIAKCNAHDSSYKGLALSDDNKSLTPPTWFNYTGGDQAGNLGMTVSGVQGCTPNQIVNCVAFLPVVVNQPTDTTGANRLWGVTILPFYITGSPNGNGTYNSLNAQVMGDYITEGEGTNGWTQGTQGPIVIRLTR